MEKKPYFALAYYLFVPIENPRLEVKRHKEYFSHLDVAGRIYLSEEGINGQMSGAAADVERYMSWLREDPRFEKVDFKIHQVQENIFARMTVKYRSQLVAIDQKVDLSLGGEYLSPDQWKKMLEEEDDYLLIDVRNRYEWEIGHFEGATLPPLENFRDFPRYADELSKEHPPEKTKVMMYCTGGIRCEVYSALLKEKGFENVYQLKGGVIDYGLKEGSEHWKGKLFVFDDRLAVSIDGKESEAIAHCCHCHLASDTYYNCANMDCNALFICCPSCVEIYQGCCGHACRGTPRVRPFSPQRGNKPFRRKHEVVEA